MAFAFPGQGSQRVGMLSGDEVPAQVVSAVKDASDILGVDLVAASGDEATINDTRVSQPLMLAAGVGTYRAWLDAGGRPPVIAAGHSLGEYAALVCAGAIGYADAVKVVQRRAGAMHDAVPAGKGRMSAVLGLDGQEVGRVCGEVGGEVWPANLNAPGQVVIAGLAGDVDAVSKACLEAGAKRAVPLPVSVPSHCPLMGPAVAELMAALASIEFAIGDFAVVQNATSKVANSPEGVLSNLCDQLVRLVDWVTIVKAVGAKAELVVECGPSGVLHGLNRRITEATRCTSLGTKQAIAELAG